MIRRLIAPLGLLSSCSAPNPAYDLGGDEGADGGTTLTSGASDDGPTAGDDGGTGGDGGSDNADTADGESTGDPGMWIFEDVQWEGQFALGSSTKVVWADEHLELANGSAAGTFTSRVFSAGAEGQWQTLSWLPLAPYGKPLPDHGAAETGYQRGNVDMSGNVLLLHLNLAGELANGEAIADSSGLGNDGLLTLQSMMSPVTAGILGAAFADRDPESYISVPAAEIAPYASDFTWSIWVRNTDCTKDNYWLAMNDTITTSVDSPSVYVGCLSCGRNGGVAAGVRAGNGSENCFPIDIDWSLWHNVVLVKVGQPDFDARVYVDGMQVGTFGGQLSADLAPVGQTMVYLGGSPDPGMLSTGDYDEVAIWNRKLNDPEIASLYRRGAERLSLQVRACEKPDCADQPPFSGPTDFEEVGFVDRPNATSPGTELDLPDLQGAYVQYAARFVRRAGTEGSPALARVTIEGAPL